jgi:hypothetical protein
MDNLFNESDLIYNLMLCWDYKNIIKLCTINKLTLKISNNQHLWKEKIKNDELKLVNYNFKNEIYNHVVLNSLNYKKEYILINKAFLKATTMTEVMLLLKINQNFDRIYLCINNGSININDYNFYWLNHYDLKNIVMFEINSVKDEFAVPSFLLHRSAVRSENIYVYNDEHEICYSKYKFIDFFTKLFYHYPEIFVEDHCDNSFVFDINKLIKHKNLKNIPDEDLNIVNCRKKYWINYLNL